MREFVIKHAQTLSSLSESVSLLSGGLFSEDSGVHESSDDT